MANSETNSGRSLRWADRLLPPSILQGSQEQARLARILLTGVASAMLIALLFAVIHVTNGAPNRALFSLGSSVVLAIPLMTIWATKSVDAGVHMTLGLCTGMVLVSPWVAGEGEPAFVALMIVPVSAALMSGPRAATIWTVVITTVLISYASFYPFSDEVRKLAWITTIMAAGGGFAATLIERARERASKEALAGLAVRNQTEAALSESQALFETAFRHSNSVLALVCFESGRLLDVNEMFLHVSQRKYEEAVGKTLTELNAWIVDDDRKRIFQQLAARGRIDSIELRMRNKSGELLWLLGSVELIQRHGNACLLTELVEITERKRNSEALERYRVELEERFAERGEQLHETRDQLRQRDRLAAVGTLAAGVAHQINNPIGGIVAATEFATLMDDDEDRENIRTQAISTALKEARRCGRIVKNILKFSRDEPTAKWVEDLSTMVASATELARTHVITQGGSLKVQLTSDPLLVRASTIDIEQVVLNLIHNASESKTGGADVTIETAIHDDCAEITVTDNGDGIDPAQRPRIFEPFYTSREDQGGSGLGLSVVHGIVGDHGGKLEIESVPTGGTRVRVMLPLSPEDPNHIV